MFRVEAELVSPKLRAHFHKSSKGKLYAVNYQMTAAMQQMGLGGSAMDTLAGFFDFPCSGLVQKHLTKVESVLGPVQKNLQAKQTRRNRGQN